MNLIKPTVKVLALSLLNLLLSQSISFAQVKDEITNSFKKYQHTTVQEKIFVHTDKSAYLAGEILWFKIYIVDASFHKPINLSKVVDVDVLDSKNNPAIQAKIAIKDGIGSGSAYIPVTLSNGNYKLRAYSSWMKNFSPDYYFEKNITVLNPLKSPDVPAKDNIADYDVEFFPEGGNLLAGVDNKVAFKVTTSNGIGLANYRGAIINEQNDTLVRFKPLKFGIGSFTFTPVANGAYKAIIKAESGKPLIKALPPVNAQGYAMKLKDNNNQQVDVVVNSNLAGEVYLFAHTRQSVKVAMAANITAGSAYFVIDKNKLGEGVSHITIFNSAKQPVCERLYFKRPKPQLLLDATTDKAQYGARKKVDINITAKSPAGTALAANLSMSVYSVDSLQHIDTNGIFSYLWLRSDLRGNIESPDYYFKNADAETDEAVDNLMLSQGWRRFQWRKILSDTAPVVHFLPEYNDHLITAKITNIITGKPAGDVVAYLSVPGKRVQLYTSKSDSLGQLVFNTKQLFGPGEIVAQTNSERDSIYRIDILSPFSEQYSKNKIPQFNLEKGLKPTLEQHSLAMQVENLYTSNKIKQFYNPGVDSSGFFGKPYKTYLLDNYTRFTTMEEVLREYIREVYVVRSQHRYHIKVISEAGFLDGDPLVLLDDVPVFNIDKVIAIDPLKVKKLEVVRDRYYYGSSVSEGVLSYTTYKGDLGGVEMDPHAVILDYEGLQLQREFYSPIYDTEKAEKSRIPDFRNLLFWSPEINIGPDGKSQISFYTSDQTGRYVGLLQGITSNGDSGSQYFMFDVK